jgi:hypothetical protein
MNGEGEAGTRSDALDKAVHGVRSERPSPLRREHIATIGKLPAQLSYGADFIAAKRVTLGLPFLTRQD